MQMGEGRPSLPGRHLRGPSLSVLRVKSSSCPSGLQREPGVGQRDTPPSFLCVWDCGVAGQGQPVAGNPWVDRASRMRFAGFGRASPGGFSGSRQGHGPPTLGCVGSLSAAGDALGVRLGSVRTTVVGGSHAATPLPIQRPQVGSPAASRLLWQPGSWRGPASFLGGRSRAAVGSAPGALKGPRGPRGTDRHFSPFRSIFSVPSLRTRGRGAEVGPWALCCRPPHGGLCSAGTRPPARPGPPRRARRCCRRFC